MNHLVVIAVFAAATGIEAQTIESFGVTVAAANWADTTDQVSVSLWHGGSVYQCSYDGMSQDTTYICSSTTPWTLSDTACYSSADYNLLVDNQDTNAVDIDKVFLTVDGQEYTIDSWCTSADDWQAFSGHDIEYETDVSLCQDGYVNYDAIGLDSDQAHTTTAMFHFDLTNPGVTILMEDAGVAADVCVFPDECDCETVAPPQCDCDSEIAELSESFNLLSAEVAEMDNILTNVRDGWLASADAVAQAGPMDDADGMASAIGIESGFVMTAKDMGVAALVVMNVIFAVVIAIVCKQSGGRTKYYAVGVSSDHSEVELMNE